MRSRLHARLRRLEARRATSAPPLTLVLTHVDPDGAEHTKNRFRYYVDGARPAEQSDDGGLTWQVIPKSGGGLWDGMG